MTAFVGVLTALLTIPLRLASPRFPVRTTLPTAGFTRTARLVT